MASTSPFKKFPCIFPFIYKGKQHDECVDGMNGGSWCPTNIQPHDNVDYLDSESHNNDQGGDWGYCEKSCAISSKQNNNNV